MVEFKVGDRVKRIYGDNGSFEKGMVGVITDIYTDKQDNYTHCNVEHVIDGKTKLNQDNVSQNLELVEKQGWEGVNDVINDIISKHKKEHSLEDLPKEALVYIIKIQEKHIEIFNKMVNK